MSPEVMETKAKINKNYIKPKNCTAKETRSKTKKQPTEWEKIFANHMMQYMFNIQNIYKETYVGNSLVIQWLGLHTFPAGDLGLIPGWETQVPTICTLHSKKINKRIYDRSRAEN